MHIRVNIYHIQSLKWKHSMFHKSIMGFVTILNPLVPILTRWSSCSFYLAYIQLHNHLWKKVIRFNMKKISKEKKCSRCNNNIKHDNTINSINKHDNSNKHTNTLTNALITTNTTIIINATTIITGVAITTNATTTASTSAR